MGPSEIIRPLIFRHHFQRRLFAGALVDFPVGTHDLAGDIQHVGGNADGFGLVGNCPGNGLFDPPGGIG